MDVKRILRGPMVWVVLIVGIGVLLLSLQGAGGFTRIDTSAAVTLINDGKVAVRQARRSTRSTSP